MQNKILFPSASIYQNIIRTYARKSANKRKNANPGIQKRLNVLEEREESNLENVNVEELDSDFMSLGHMHREHEKELKQYQEKEKYWIIRRKYFKENKINFLTWNDKEQIRYLHQTNSAEWTFEKLSESFPALVDTIAKIIKGKWQTKNDAKKQKHDHAVEKNWDTLKQGKLSEVLPPNLITHLSKFSSRKQNVIYDEEASLKRVVNTIEPKSKEFSSIINSYMELKNKTNTTPKIEEQTIVKNESSILEDFSSSYSNKCVPLSLLKKNSNIELVDQEKHKLENIFHGDDSNKSDVEKGQNKYLISNKNELTKNKLNSLQYPEKINIPKDKYKKGCSYKVNDCYYDDDGEFLYRVPGMN